MKGDFLLTMKVNIDSFLESPSERCLQVYLKDKRCKKGNITCVKHLSDYSHYSDKIFSVVLCS